MIKVLLCSEGVRDSGRESQEGALQVLMKKCVEQVVLGFECVPSSTIKTRSAFHKGRSKGTNKGTYLLKLAAEKDCTHIAYHRDEDGIGFKKAYRQVESCFELPKSKNKRCISIIPQRMTENWLLADIGKYLGASGILSCENNSEQIEQPKKQLEDLLVQHGKDVNAKTYADVADTANILSLRKRCRISFEQFYQDMQKFVSGE